MFLKVKIKSIVSKTDTAGQKRGVLSPFIVGSKTHLPELSPTVSEDK